MAPSPIDFRSILIIGRKRKLHCAVERELRSLGVRVHCVTAGALGLAMIGTTRPDVVLVDLPVSDMTGLELCDAIRRVCASPLIVLSECDVVERKVELLAAGADDYVTKPCGWRELVARICVQLRRTPPATSADCPPPVTIDGVRIDFAHRRVTRDRAVVPLTWLEWRLLTVLAGGSGRTLTHRQIFDGVWQRPYGNPQCYLRVHITKLRKKVEPCPPKPRLILTDLGVGYRFELPTAG
jgi:two-component system KDP operon response regulator KdpE